MRVGAAPPRSAGVAADVVVHLIECAKNVFATRFDSKMLHAVQNFIGGKSARLASVKYVDLLLLSM